MWHLSNMSPRNTGCKTNSAILHAWRFGSSMMVPHYNASRENSLDSGNRLKRQGSLCWKESRKRRVHHPSTASLIMNSESIMKCTAISCAMEPQLYLFLKELDAVASRKIGVVALGGNVMVTLGFRNATIDADRCGPKSTGCWSKKLSEWLDAVRFAHECF